MCGACGSRSATGRLHWSSPFLASVPARDAAARTMTRWLRAGGIRLVVSPSVAGFRIGGPTGRSQLADDLGGVVETLDRYDVERATLLADHTVSAMGIVKGRPTTPAPRTHTTAPPAPDPTLAALRLDDDRDRHLRTPAILAWFSLADATGIVSRIRLEVSVSAAAGMSIHVEAGRVKRCEVTRPPTADMVWADQQLPPGLVDMLRPKTDRTGSVPEYPVT